MRRYLLLSLIACCFAPTCLGQSKKNTITVDEALASYDFSQAESLLNAEISKLQRRRQNTDSLELKLQYVRRAASKLAAVERVVVFDSLIVSKDSLLSALCLSEESGTIRPTSSLAGLSGGDGTLFMPEMKDKVYYSAPASNGVLQLFSADLFGGQPGEAQQLEGLAEDSYTPCNYPYMMPDGVTLYYAQQAGEGLGGYDIYMTRFDADEHRFLSPENVGMPFNSPANDYLMLVDEAYNIGCFASDRCTSPDSVCVYYFIPNAARRVYFEEEVGEEQLRLLARLSDIRLTWGEQGEITSAQSRLSECRGLRQGSAQSDFTFIVSPSHVCHSLSDFRNPQARKLAEKWQQDSSVLSQWKASLSDLRLSYAHATSSEKNSLKPKILKLEADTESLTESLRAQEKAIRNAELGGS
ncbi:MAG: hypothetical protein LUI09_06030 [Prevotellaceae bacterium]|nr:hypothetical protein [Prevotellaceae bacterium]